MPILQMIKEYRFDLKVADLKLTDTNCVDMVNTFQTEALRGRGNLAIRSLIEYSEGRGVALRNLKRSDLVTFQEYLQYLSKRAQK